MFVKKGSTDVSVEIRIVDATDGTPETGVEHNTSGIDLWYRRQGAAKVSITEAALSALTDAHSDGGIEHIGDGYYRLDVPDAAFASGASSVLIGGTVTGMVVIGVRVQLVDFDPEDGNLGLSNVSANVTQFGGQALTADGGRPEVNVSHWAGSSVSQSLGFPAVTVAVMNEDAAADIDIDGKIRAALGMSSANLDTQIGTIDSNVDSILEDTGTTLPGTLSSISSAVGTVDSVVDAIKVTTDKLDDTLEDQGSGTYGFTEAALQEAPTGAGSGATAQEVWEYATRTLTAIDEDSTTLDLDATIRAAVGMSAANLDTQLGTIDSNVDSILDDTGTSGVVVASIANGAITANAIASNAITADKVASDAVSEIQSGLATASALATVDSVVDAIKVTTDKLDDTLEDDGGTYRFTQNALEQAPSGGEGGTSDWTADEKTAIRAILGIPSSGTTPDDPSSGILDTIRDAIGVVDGNVDAILEDTGTTIPSTLSSITSAISTIDGIVDEILVDTGTTLPGTLSTIAGYIDTEIASLISAVGTVDGVVDAIKAVTDNLPDSGALTSLATASALATVDANVDAILEDTGTTIPSTLSSLLTTALTESYRGVGQTGSVAQLLYEIIAHMGNSSVSSTTKTLKKLDRSTTAKTYTLDDANAPTSIEEAS